MPTRFDPIVLSDHRSARKPRTLAFALMGLGLAAALAVAHQFGVRVVKVEAAALTGEGPALISRTELTRIEAQYQERLEALRNQIQLERQQMREAKRVLLNEVAAIHSTDKQRALQALASEKSARERALLSERTESERALRAQHQKLEQQLRSEQARAERALKAQVLALQQERDRLTRQKDAQAALVKAEQVKIEQQYKRQLGDLQKKLASTVERISQIETAQVSLMRSLGVKSSETLGRNRGGQGGIYQPLDRPRPGASSFETGTQSLREDLRLLERGIEPIERAWRESLLPLTQRPVALPIADPFYISSHFGLRRDPITRRAARHDGVDLVAKHGTPVLATASGRVTRSGPAGPHGQLVEIEHANGYVTRYAHLSQRSVKVGQAVVLGQMIGRVGRTGRATGVHLHYELLHNGQHLDPTRAFSQPLWAQHDRQSFSYR